MILLACNCVHAHPPPTRYVADRGGAPDLTPPRTTTPYIEGNKNRFMLYDKQTNYKTILRSRTHTCLPVKGNRFPVIGPTILRLKFSCAMACPGAQRRWQKMIVLVHSLIDGF